MSNYFLDSRTCGCSPIQFLKAPGPPPRHVAITIDPTSYTTPLQVLQHGYSAHSYPLFGMLNYVPKQEGILEA